MDISEMLRELPIPQQYTGKEITIESRRDNDTGGRNPSLLDRAIRRLKDVNNWHRIMGEHFAVFQLTDAKGRELYETVPAQGMHFRVDIAGPGSKAGDGYDWVEIVDTADFETGAVRGSLITVRPSDNPTTGNTHTAHFYAPTSTSTFLVYGNNTETGALILDKNIAVNEDNGNLADRIRNTIFGAAGMAAFSKMQWQLLADALILD